MMEEGGSSWDMEVSSNAEDVNDEANSILLIEKLRNEVSQLREQIRFLSALGQGCVPPSASGEEEEEEDGGDRSGPVAHVIFFNNQESLYNRQKIEEFLMCLAMESSDAEMQVESSTNQYQPNAVDLREGGCQSHDCDCQRASLKATGSVEYYRLFCLDRLGFPMDEIAGEAQLQENIKVIYTQVYLEPFWVDRYTEIEERRLRTMAIKCFNCKGDHHIRDCPEPKNFEVINARRQEFTNSLGTQGADKRYHVTTADDRLQKYAPGKISNKLRKALGIGKNDYPPYIYRMRELGYPPGYTLLEAEETLSVYDDVDASDKVDGRPVQAKEIVYPGFNDEEWKKRDGLMKKNGDKKLDSTTPTIGVGKSVDDIDDLGTLGDYEFEEAEECEGGGGGGGFIGFGLRKLLTKPEEGVEEEGEEKEEEEEEEEVVKPKKRFSLDFPPGLVHDESECESSPKRWNALKKLLQNKLSAKRKSVS